MHYEIVFYLANLKGTSQFGDVGADERILLKWKLKTVCEDVNWAHIPYVRIEWRTCTNRIINLLVP